MSIEFDNAFVQGLPVDPSADPVPRQVLGAACSRVSPTPVSTPRLLAWSGGMAEELGLSAADLQGSWLAALAGNGEQPGMTHYAHCYGGHQFGHWAGQLGDGRAISLGEVRGRSGQTWELQLKGAGRTPYSRGADGRAVLRSSLREFICSEAMHHLGVPTTRALSLVATGDSVIRDMLYDGHPAPEPGAIVCRVAPSFLRFGSFELPAARQDSELLRQLLQFTLKRHCPEIDAEAPDAVVQWYRQICRQTAELMVHWMRVGFVHGVMNTDNMSVHGVTIDYGPYGWLEPYEPEWTPNTTDLPGRRYCFGNQPAIAQWNLAQLGGALTSLAAREDLESALAEYATAFQRAYGQQFAAKLGLPEWNADAEAVLNELWPALQQAQMDYCLFFRHLAAMPDGGTVRAADLADISYAPDALNGDAGAQLGAWLARYRDLLARIGESGSVRGARMNMANPLYVPRNYLLQLAIDAAEQDDLQPLQRLQTVLRNPYVEQAGMADLAAPRPAWAENKPGCSALSCSS